jgi:hypothetical protein
MNFLKHHLTAAADFHDGMALAHRSAHLAGHGDHHDEMYKLHSTHAQHHRDLLSKLSEEPVDGANNVGAGGVVHQFSALFELEFQKRFGLSGNEPMPLPRNLSFVGQSESAVQLQDAVDVGHVKLVPRPGMTAAGMIDSAERVVKEHGDVMKKFVEV